MKAKSVSAPVHAPPNGLPINLKEVGEERNQPNLIGVRGDDGSKECLKGKVVLVCACTPILQSTWGVGNCSECKQEIPPTLPTLLQKRCVRTRTLTHTKCVASLEQARLHSFQTSSRLWCASVENALPTSETTIASRGAELGGVGGSCRMGVAP
jgi:hypothetical protein